MKTNKLAITILLTLLLTFGLTITNETLFSANTSIIRLHILANSDSDADQALKYKVRDRILAEVHHLCDEQEQPDQYIIAHQEQIREIALDEIRKQGYSYDVTVQYGTFAFPVREYGGYVFPAGMYRGVRILIGAGAGQNWWCVMYPPLCFTNETNGGVPEASRAQLAQSAELIGDGDKIVVKPKWKVKEWWDKLAG